MKKRLLSFLLAACMAASLLAVPAGAASVRFSDVSDRDTILAVESLRLLGVTDGYGDNTFRPGAALTRAQFCKMAVFAMDGSNELGLYNTITIFPDVKPSHWAAGFINMASRKGIISGYADGQFHPDRTVTVGQAVTILLRLLGYRDEEIGGVWPDSYMAVASTIGLTDGVGGSGNTSLTRGQAAALFLNLLRSDTAEGGSYLGTIGATVMDGQVLVTSSATGPDGQDTAMQLASGTEVYQLASGTASNGALNGCRGTLVLNRSGKVMTFVPAATDARRTVTVASVKASQIVDTSGAAYTVTGRTRTYYNGEETSWSNVFAWVSAGSSVTLYLDAGGGVDYIFVGGGAAVNKAVVVYSSGSVTGFSGLAEGSTNYQIYKNGVAATARDMRQYDVATYSAATNTIRVCDTRITGYYESCSPNPGEPSEITLLGHEFPVLPMALDTVSKFKPGDQITLLLTEDNQVAGAVAAQSGSVSGNAVGIAGEGSVALLCGITVSGNVNQNNASDLEGQLVRVSSNKRGELSLSRPSGGAGGDLDVAARTVGSRKLADNVMVFQVGENGAEAVSLSQLEKGIIPASEISYARTNWADQVDLIVLGSTVGSVFLYGRVASVNRGGAQSGTGAHPVYLDVIQLDAGGSVRNFETAYQVAMGDYVAISTAGQGGNTRVAALVRLSVVKDVPNSAWSGQTSVTTGGRSYPITSDVLCYNRDSGSWVTLAEAHAYAGKCDLYIHNGQVRVIEVRH